MNKVNFKFIASILIVLLLSISLYLIFKDNTEYTDNSYLASDITIIKPKVAGYITDVLVRDNEEVKKDQIIAKIDDKNYKLALVKAESEYKAQEAKIESIRKQIDIQELETNQAIISKDTAKVVFEKAEKDFKRASALVKDRAVSQQDYDKSFEIKVNAENDYKIKIILLELTKIKNELLSAELEESKARLESLKANVELAKIDYDNTIIKAQTDGKLSRRSLQIGQLVFPEAALAYIVQKPIWVKANFKEIQVGKMKKGQSAIVKVDALEGKKFKARIDSLSPATGAEFSILPPENATGNFTKIVQRVPVKLIFEENQNLERLRAGLSCETEVMLE